MKNKFKVGDKIRDKNWNINECFEITEIEERCFYGILHKKNSEEIDTWFFKEYRNWEYYKTEEDKKIKEAVDENNKKWLKCMNKAYDKIDNLKIYYGKDFYNGFIKFDDLLSKQAKKMRLMK